MTELKKKWHLIVVHAVASIPLLIVAVAGLFSLTGAAPNAFKEMAAELGDPTLWAFTAMLACTPLYIFTGWSRFLDLRKPLGLYSFAYIAIEFAAFMGERGFSWAVTWADISAQTLLVTGFIATVLMLPLALTSTKWSMKTLGKSWKRLHRLVYVIPVFIVLHLFFLPGIEGPVQAIFWGIIFAILLVVRIPPIRQAIIETRRKLIPATGASSAPKSSNLKSGLKTIHPVALSIGIAALVMACMLPLIAAVVIDGDDDDEFVASNRTDLQVEDNDNGIFIFDNDDDEDNGSFFGDDDE
jgi:sulfoxide reductase heme-binding subunit YedZ